MTSKIFLTGATGYIGGDLLHALTAALPIVQIAALVRSPAKATQVSGAFPNVRIVHGDLDSTNVIEREAADADVVINLASTKHLESAKAIARGLQKGGRSKPGHWIQISGASVLSSPEIDQKVFGETSNEVYDDHHGVAKILSLIEWNPSRVVDNLIVGFSKGSLSTPFNTALVFPPIIYGQGRGPTNQRSIQVPELARVVLQSGCGFQVGKGLSRWSNVHISDLSNLLLKLVQESLKGAVDERLWNQNGIYFTGNSERTFGEISQLVTHAAYDQGFISKGTIEKILTPEEADAKSPHGSVLWATNARAKGNRATDLLGWRPQGGSLEQDIPRLVKVEAEMLGQSSEPKV